MRTILSRNIVDILDEIKERYEDIEQRNKKLVEENKLLKSEHYKDEEIQRLKAELDKEREMIAFRISEEGKKKRNDFFVSHKCDKMVNCHYEIYPTGIGEVIYYVCGCGEKVMLEDI